MKALSRIGVALALVLGLMAVTTLSAAETTLSGTMKCGKCSLKKSEKCQDVLVVTDAAGAATEVLADKERSGREGRPPVQGRGKGDRHRRSLREGRDEVDHRLQDREDDLGFSNRLGHLRVPRHS